MKKLAATALASIVSVAICTAVSAADVSLRETAAVPANQQKQAPAVPARVKLIDINTATREQLKTIPGVTDEYAGKIIAGRPYNTKEQLKTKEILPAEMYGKISKLIKALC